MSFDFFSIGHSNIGRALCGDAACGNVGAIADVRSAPFSRFCPWFSAKTSSRSWSKTALAICLMGRRSAAAAQSGSLLRRCRRLRGDGAATRLSGRARSPDRRCGPGSRAWHWKWPLLPDVRGARAARLPPLSAGRPCTGCARFYRRSHPLRRQRSSRMRPPNAACWSSPAMMATSLQLDRTANSGSVSPPRPRRCVPGEGKPSGAKPMKRAAMRTPMRTSLLAVLLLVAGLNPAFAQDTAAPAPAQDTDTLDPTPPGTLQSAAAAAARQSQCAVDAGQGIVRPRVDAVSRSGGARSAPMPTAASPARWRCPSPARPGRSCGCRATATGARRGSSSFIERFGANAKKVGWNGLLIGDMAQPRGGPMITGHASHQIGLDADIWFTPMPDHVLSREEREMDGAVDMVAADRLGVDPKVWTHTRTELIKTAAEDPDDHPHLRQCRDQESKCAARPERIAAGSPKCGHGGAMPSTSTSASLARPDRPRMQGPAAGAATATAAATRSIAGSGNRRCTRRRRKCRRSRDRR